MNQFAHLETMPKAQLAGWVEAADTKDLAAMYDEIEALCMAADPLALSDEFPPKRPDAPQLDAVPSWLRVVASYLSDELFIR